MARYTLTIPESKTEQVLKHLKSLCGVKVEEALDPNNQKDDLIMHDWQKEIIDQRLQSVKDRPENLVSEKEMNARIEKHL
ncbi:MAG TPA: hypothetical protein PK798_11065 [Flavobacteriales bacterium]|nr:hypothetical protein [Flavobacteriales bacterium]HRJ39322.1 hypothetical protein [Flavobacteriales bacterium]